MSAEQAAAALHEPLKDAARRRPDTFLVVVVVSLFLGFQVYQMQFGSKLDDHRINQCHLVQAQGHEVMARVARALDDSSTQFALLKESNEDLQDALEELRSEVAAAAKILAAQSSAFRSDTSLALSLAVRL